METVEIFFSWETLGNGGKTGFYHVLPVCETGFLGGLRHCLDMFGTDMDCHILSSCDGKKTDPDDSEMTTLCFFREDSKMFFSLFTDGLFGLWPWMAMDILSKTIFFLIFFGHSM